jgi:transposase
MARSVPDHDRLEDLRRMARLKAFAPVAERLRAVILTREGLAQKTIAGKLDHTEAWVHRWVGRYIEGGVEALGNRPPPGRPVKLRRQDEKVFVARVTAGPRPGDKVAAWRGEDLRRVLEGEFGARYALSGVYALLQRLKLSWLAPRPRHPKSDKEAQEQFRAQAPLLSKSSRPRTPRSSSSGGSRTRRVWGCAAP